MRPFMIVDRLPMPALPVRAQCHRQARARPSAIGAASPRRPMRNLPSPLSDKEESRTERRVPFAGADSRPTLSNYKEKNAKKKEEKKTNQKKGSLTPLIPAELSGNCRHEHTMHRQRGALPSWEVTVWGGFCYFGCQLH